MKPSKFDFELASKDFTEKSEQFKQLKSVVDGLEDRIDEAEIAAVVARRTGIPVAKMLTAERFRGISTALYQN